MELIPILSTIILVATISTFILAIGAYILYKLQEKRADQYEEKEVKPETAEVVEPIEFGRKELVVEKPEGKPVFIKRHYQPVETIVKEGRVYRRRNQEELSSDNISASEPKFMKYVPESYVATGEDKDSGVISWR
ncbi:MAG: hypothetical protein PVF17_06825 [Ignavibacteria bacterium]|jgi:hypothetical protein